MIFGAMQSLNMDILSCHRNSKKDLVSWYWKQCSYLIWAFKNRCPRYGKQGRKGLSLTPSIVFDANSIFVYTK